MLVMRTRGLVVALAVSPLPMQSIVDKTAAPSWNRVTICLNSGGKGRRSVPPDARPRYGFVARGRLSRIFAVEVSANVSPPCQAGGRVKGGEKQHGYGSLLPPLGLPSRSW